ncbi:MAG TPA: hypothetical protein VGU25_04595 [Acidobacteriaceae bacterium]|nr:hypothetical protein [Acidobacteriaceae bacterium]
MPSHSVKALVCGVLLIPLAWIGIVLVGKLHGGAALVPAVVVWALVLLADLWFGVVSVVRARRHRIERTPEPKLGGR